MSADALMAAKDQIAERIVHLEELVAIGQQHPEEVEKNPHYFAEAQRTVHASKGVLIALEYLGGQFGLMAKLARESREDEAS